MTQPKYTEKYLKSLDEDATQGRWGQFHPDYCEHAKGKRFPELDTSHDVSGISDNGDRVRVGSFKHSDDAEFAEVLVNAYRSGLLVWRDESSDDKTGSI